jgi:GST-like protein
MSLFGARTGNCLRTAVALEESGLSYQVVPVDLRNLEHRGPKHLELNPAGKVPVLVDETGPERLVLAQSNAIMLHVADMVAGQLLPTDGHPRAVALERFFHFTTDVIALSHAAFFLRDKGREPAREILTSGAVTAMIASERYLVAPYMAGEQFTLADISAFTIATSFFDAIDWKKHTRLRHWYDRIADRPAVQRGMVAFG